MDSTTDIVSDLTDRIRGRGVRTQARIALLLEISSSDDDAQLARRVEALKQQIESKAADVRKALT